MNEFNNRMAVQRQVLQIINRKKWGKETLFGLSSKAIERWIAINLIDPQVCIACLIKEVASKLFFLATKSQEQISEDYRLLSEEVSILIGQIEEEVGHNSAIHS